MSSQEESDALLEAKIATLVEPYKKASINTESCTVNAVPSAFLLVKQFEKMQKFLHHLVRQEIFPQLMARASEKGIISSANSLTLVEILELDSWIRTKEGGAIIKEEFDRRKLERKAAKRLHKEMSSSGDITERKVDDASQNASKRARILNTEDAST